MDQTASNREQGDASGEPLHWRVHLRKRDPSRLPIFVLVLFIGGACVWLLFHAPLPVLAALLLLTGAASEYLFPNTYHCTEEGAMAQTLTGRSVLAWADVRRAWLVPGGLMLSPLPVPSRRDAFRGVLLRFAPKGQPGSRASVLQAVAQFAPHLPPIAVNGNPVAINAHTETL